MLAKITENDWSYLQTHLVYHFFPLTLAELFCINLDLIVEKLISEVI